MCAGIPEPDEAQLCAMLRASCKRLNRYGITSCQSDDYETFPGVPYKTVQKLLRTPGLMTVRVNEQAQFTNVEALSAYIESGDAYFEDDMFRAGPLKIISDGSLGARTACLSRPYADDENARGIPLYTNAELNGLSLLRTKRDFPLRYTPSATGRSTTYWTLTKRRFMSTRATTTDMASCTARLCGVTRLSA